MGKEPEAPWGARQLRLWLCWLSEPWLWGLPAPQDPRASVLLSFPCRRNLPSRRNAWSSL